jgi:L-iditol 2-dehydrogenase
MKALVFEKPEQPIVVDKPMPSLKDTEVLVKTSTVGICHSDYELLGGRYIIPISYPVTPGHEWCGEVMRAGDRVVGECVVRTPERLHHFGFSMDGADCEYFNVNPDWLHKLPDTVLRLRHLLNMWRRMAACLWSASILARRSRPISD